VAGWPRLKISLLAPPATGCLHLIEDPTGDEDDPEQQNDVVNPHDDLRMTGS
jgi:hypothetical protein